MPHRHLLQTILQGFPSRSPRDSLSGPVKLKSVLIYAEFCEMMKPECPGWVLKFWKIFLNALSWETNLRVLTLDDLPYIAVYIFDAKKEGNYVQVIYWKLIE